MILQKRVTEENVVYVVNSSYERIYSINIGDYYFSNQGIRLCNSIRNENDYKYGHLDRDGQQVHDFGKYQSKIICQAFPTIEGVPVIDWKGIIATSKKDLRNNYSIKEFKISFEQGFISGHMNTFSKNDMMEFAEYIDGYGWQSDQETWNLRDRNGLWHNDNEGHMTISQILLDWQISKCPSEIEGEIHGQYFILKDK